MDRVALDLGFIQIYWYSIFIFIGIFFASIMILRETKKQNINEDFILLYLILITILSTH